MSHLRGIASRDADALGILYDLSNELVYSVALRILRDAAEAEEITLSVYRYIWDSASIHDCSRGTISTWLIMLTRRRALHRLRELTAGRGNPVARTGVAEKVPAAEQKADLNAEQRLLFRRVFGELASEQRNLLELTFYSGLSQDELASTLNLPWESVRSRLKIALSRLRDLLKGVRPA
jgi:RNA polymerase sigma-70 factor (ECF subfamily)